MEKTTAASPTTAASKYTSKGASKGAKAIVTTKGDHEGAMLGPEYHISGAAASDSPSEKDGAKKSASTSELVILTGNYFHSREL